MRQPKITSCARCGGNHRLLKLKRFRRPIVDDDGTTWTHWGRCPRTGDPVLHRRAK